MRALCALTIVVGALAGCDQVFGLEGRETEAEVPVTITDLEILGTPPTTEETRDVRASVHGPADSRQTYAVTATAGTLVPSGGVIDLDSNGDAEITSKYQANTPGMITLTAMAASAATTVTFEVLDLDVAGRESGTTHYGAVGDMFFGTKISVASAGELRYLGVDIRMVTTSSGKFALYRDGGGQPANRIADLSTAQPLAMGRNVFPIPPLMLDAGDYWIIGIFDRAVAVTCEVVSGGAWGMAAGTFTDQMPETVSNFAVMAGLEYAYFLLVVPQ